MTGSARRFTERAVRYSVRPQDDSVMKFAFNQRKQGQYFQTEFLNISETGLAFTCDRRNLPRMGEVIKVEFPIPGHERMAWYARVVRIEERTFDEFVYDDEGSEPTSRLPRGFIIAVTFLDLPEGHARSITEGLSRRFAQINNSRQMERLNQAFTWARHHYVQSTIYALGVLIAIFAINALSNYFKEKEDGTVIWGTRQVAPTSVNPTDLTDGP